jgi:hypothetical protein
MSYISRLQSIIQNKLAPRATGTTVPIGGIGLGGSISFSQTGSSGGLIQIPNSVVTITTTGRPVSLSIITDPTNSTAFGQVAYQDSAPSAGGLAVIEFLRGSTRFTSVEFSGFTSGAQPNFNNPLATVDFPTAGTYTYSLSSTVLNGTSGTATLFLQGVQFLVYEL